MVDRFLGPLTRVSARPRIFLTIAFATIWVGVTIGLHYVPRSYGSGSQDVTLNWDGAVGIAFFVAAVGTALTYFLHYRQSD
jgi:hypothetical protein